MRRLPGLDLLRAVAVAWVMLFHAYLAGGLPVALETLELSGWMGVDLFFVLSGYLIGGQLFDALSRDAAFSFGAFWLRRARRILPAYLVVLALYALWPAFHESDGMAPMWQFLTFTMNVLHDSSAERTFAQAWSLCVEEHFYLVFPLVAVALVRRASARAFVVGCIAIVAFGIALRARVWLVDMAPLLAGADAPRGIGQVFAEEIYYPTWTRLDGLLAGVILAAIRVFRPERWEELQRRANLWLAIGVALVAAAIVLFDDRLGFAATVFGYPLLSAGLAFVVLAAAGEHGVLSRVRVPGAAWLAGVSYSLYLVHKQIFHLVHENFSDALDGLGLVAFAIYGAAALAGAAVLHYAVERPCLRGRGDSPRLSAAPSAS
jgi:peptidoglycan/LPS O-acetylase OafA/YrhL